MPGFELPKLQNFKRAKSLWLHLCHALSARSQVQLVILFLCLGGAIAAQGEPANEADQNQSMVARTTEALGETSAETPLVFSHDPDTATEGIYKLSPGDRIRILLYGREDISKEYRVNDAGRVGVPTLGTFDAADRSAEQLESSLLEALERTTKQSGFVSVEIVERRPVLVTGLVAKSGSYPSTPDMTVIHATALAGGTLSVATAPWLPTDALRESSRKRASEEELRGLLATRSRLIASRDESAEVGAVPELVELAGEQDAALLMNGQQEILYREHLSFTAQKSSLEASIDESRTEIAAYDKEIANIKEQRGLREQMSDTLKSLTKRGLTTQHRVNESQFLLISLDRDAQSAIANQARAQQGLARAQREFAMLTHERRIQIEKALQVADEQIAKTRAAIQGSERIIAHISGLPAQILAEDQEPKFQYEILRKVKPDRPFSVIVATETTPLKPGDVLRVSALRREGGPARTANKQ